MDYLLKNAFFLMNIADELKIISIFAYRMIIFNDSIYGEN